MIDQPIVPGKPRAVIYNPQWAKLAGFLLWSVVFGLIYSQAPLYYSNQNQYFLHGLAQGERGLVREDWLANTRDPTPVFSALVAVTARFLPEWMFHVCYWLILGVYFQSMVGLMGIVTGRPDDRWLRGWFITLFLVLHSALFRLLCSKWLGTDYLWFFQAGLAGQYVLGPMFQPSVFGVGLIMSIWLFLTDRPWLAVTSSSLTAVVHSTYLLAAAVLTLTYLYLLRKDGQGKQAILLAGWSFLLVLPIVGYVVMTFAPTSAEQFSEAQAILVHVRVPHHAVPALWFDRFAIAQIAWVLLSLFLVRGTRLFTIMVFSLVVGAGLTLLQVASDNDSLALLFPWRLSIYLVPIATTIGLARLVVWLAPRLSEPVWLIRSVQAAIVLFLLLSGSYVSWTGLGFRISTEEVPMMEYVRAHTAPGEVYLIPAEMPTGPGSNASPMSIHFSDATARKNNGLIPIELQKFRLATGTPIVVDFKSIPYYDVEVLEWYRRLLWNQRFFTQGASIQAADLQSGLARYGITHVVTSANQPITWDQLEPIYRDESFRIYRLRGKIP
jgi:hypothetical protein